MSEHKKELLKHLLAQFLLGRFFAMDATHKACDDAPRLNVWFAPTIDVTREQGRVRNLKIYMANQSASRAA